jgi:hypothetical protein
MLDSELKAARSLIGEIVVFTGSEHDRALLVGPDGTSFVVGFSQALRELGKQKSKNPTLKDLLKLTTNKMQHVSTRYEQFFIARKFEKHKNVALEPQFYAFPSTDAVLNETLFVTDEHEDQVRLLFGVRYTPNPLDTTSGAFIDDLVTTSAARDAGAKAGDLITQIDSTPIHSVKEFDQFIGSNRKPSVQMTLLRPRWETEESVWRWQELRFSMKLKTEMEAYDKPAKRAVAKYDLGISYRISGFTDAESRAYVGLEVTGFRDGDVAGTQRGLRKGDIIYIANEFWVQSRKDYEYIFSSRRSVAVNVQLKRGDTYLKMAVLGLPKD